jgi:V/A-type H+/Na+-transporting ATPase subunit C
LKNPTTIYLVARTHGLKRHLLGREGLLRISRAKDLVDMHSLLLQSDYSARLGKISPLKIDASQLEKIFYQTLSQRFYYLLERTSGNTSRMIEAFCMRTEVENLKKVVRAIHANESLNRTLFMPIPRKYQTVNYSALLECHRMSEVFKLLRETPFRDLEEKTTIYERYNNPLVLEAHLDRIYYGTLEKETAKTAGEGRIRYIIGTEIDLRNLSSIMSLRHSRASPELLREIILEYYYRLTRNAVARLIEVPYEEIGKFPFGHPYYELIARALDFADKNMLPQAENIWWQYFYSCVEKESTRNPNSLVYVVGYLYLCLKEARNLTAIATGQQLKVEPDKIQSLLFI